MKDETRLWLWLNFATQYDTKLFSDLIDSFGDLSEAYECAAKKQLSFFSDTPEGVRERLLTAAAPDFMDRYVGWMEKNRIGVTTLADEDYPTLLAEIFDPPSLLFYRGKLPAEPKLPLAVIGARRCSAYGKDMARLFARQLVENGATVVTGLAAGVDSYASMGALEAGGEQTPVIGVLGCGIDVVFPRENAQLYERVAEAGAIVTEFLPKTPPLGHHFPIRNRVMSGLSKGVLCVEAAEKSGTQITMNFASEQGREVFAIPGRLTDPLSAGPNRAIRAGEAKAVFDTADILAEFQGLGDDVGLTKEAKQIPFGTLGELAQQVYMTLRMGEHTADELSELIDCDIGELNSTLTELCFSEIIRQLPGKVYEVDGIHTTVTFDE